MNEIETLKETVVTGILSDNDEEDEKETITQQNTTALQHQQLIEMTRLGFDTEDKIRNFNKRLKAYLYDKREFFNASKDMHFASLRRYKFLYYSLGSIASVLSIIISFMTGMEGALHWGMFTLLTFAISLISALFSGVLSFSDAYSKILKHFDAYTKYDQLLIDIDEFLLHDIHPLMGEQFLTHVNNKEQLIKEYETLGCCYGQIMQDSTAYKKYLKYRENYSDGSYSR